MKRWAPSCALLLSIGCSETTQPLPMNTPGDAGDAGSRTPGDSGAVSPSTDGGPRDAAAPDSGDDYPADCQSCRADGQTCNFSLNCAPGSICNSPNDRLYIPSEPVGVCVRVLCTDYSDCRTDEECVAGACRPYTCQADSDCSPGRICVGGACDDRPDPDEAVGCIVTTSSRVLAPGERLPLSAIVFGANDRVLRGVPVTWSSADPSIVRIERDEAVAENNPGTVSINGSVGNAACNSDLVVTVPRTRDADQLRVTVVDSATGVAIVGADVTAQFSQPVTGRTGTDGVLLLNESGNPQAVTVERANYRGVSILFPGTADIMVPLTSIEGTRVSGRVDTSQIRRRDVMYGLGGAALSMDRTGFGMRTLLCDPISTAISAPDLGIDGETALPGSHMFALGSRTYTDDTERCRGIPLNPDEAGCFDTVAAPGLTTVWSAVAKLRLSAIVVAAGRISQNMDAFGCGEPDTFFSLITNQLAQEATFGFARTIRMPRGGHTTVALTANTQARLLTRLTVPSLPESASNTCMRSLMVTAGTFDEHGGFVPMGFGYGRDDERSPDCVVEGISQPFGAGSGDLVDGMIPLASAPRRDGLQDREMVLMAVATDLETLAPDAQIRISGVLDRSHRRIDEEMEVGSGFIDVPSATIDRTTAALSPRFFAPSVSVLRWRLTSPTASFDVYAPAGNAPRFEPPPVPGLLRAAREATQSSFHTLETGGGYSDMWTLGAENSLHDLEGHLRRFAVRGCAGGDTLRCE